MTILLNITTFNVQKFCREAYVFISGLVCNVNIFPLGGYFFFFFSLSSAKVFTAEMDRHIAAIHVCLYNGFYTVNTQLQLELEIARHHVLMMHSKSHSLYPCLPMVVRAMKPVPLFTGKCRSHFSCASEQ